MVTGPSEGGLGFFVALELARHGARVVLAGRSPDKLAAAERAVRAAVPDADLVRLVVDLADLDSVRRAGRSASSYGPLDLLVNNAGVMATPPRPTADGVDLQLATNHYGPFLLTGLLLPQLVAGGEARPEGGGSRVVTVSSILHSLATRAPQDDPRPATGLGRWNPWTRWETYGRSKLANLLFTAELDRRCRESGLPVRALAAHPGFAGTHLVSNGRPGRAGGAVATVLDLAVRAVSQPAEHGAWPVLMAATADLPGDTFVGPGGLGELGGEPRIVAPPTTARDVGAQRGLWARSVEVVGLDYPQTTRSPHGPGAASDG